MTLRFLPSHSPAFVKPGALLEITASPIVASEFDAAARANLVRCAPDLRSIWQSLGAPRQLLESIETARWAGECHSAPHVDSSLEGSFDGWPLRTQYAVDDTAADITVSTNLVIAQHALAHRAEFRHRRL